jgi:hypothetical protein
MFKLKNSLITFAVLSLLASAIALPLPPLNHSSLTGAARAQEQQQADPAQKPTGQKQDEDPSTPNGQGEEHRADPCDHDPPGNAFGRDRRCPAAGSSSGIARGDFDNDGFADLAVGVPFDNINGVVDAGAVNVIYASRSGTGLSSFRNQIWFQGQQTSEGTVRGILESGDHFGTSLAAGDFNGDGFSDLAIGAPEENVGSITDAGAVNVLYGGPNGLTAALNEFLTQGLSESGQLRDAPEAGDRFGASLAWGDFNNNDVGDLVIGVPGEDVVNSIGANIVNAGAVHVVLGVPVPGGLPGFDQFIHQESSRVQSPDQPRVQGTAEDFDEFGSALTAGDFNGDNFSDLAIGVPGEDVGTTPVANAGAVNIIYGGGPFFGILDTVTPLLSDLWTQDTTGVNDAAEAGDQFGSSLTVGNFNLDGFQDLVIGVPLEDVGSIRDAGGVNVIYGSVGGVSTTAVRSDQFFTQDSESGTGLPGIDDQAEPEDQFGFALAVGDFNGNGIQDLAVGVPGEGLRDFTFGACFVDHEKAGAVNVILGSAVAPAGLNFFRDGDQFLFQGGNTAIAQPRYQYPLHNFGFSLTAWNFGRGPNTDLAVGVPGDGLLGIGDSSHNCGSLPPPFTSTPRAGSVEVLYGPLNLASSGNQKFNQTRGGGSGISLQGVAESFDRFGRAAY